MQAKALFNRGVRLGQLGRSEEEIAVYEDLLARFATATEPALRKLVAKALVNKGVTLGKLGHSEEAIAVYEDFLARFAIATEPALRELVAKALGNSGWQSYLTGDTARFLEQTDRSLAVSPRDDVFLSNRAFALHLLGRSDAEVMEAYAQARAATSDRDRWHKIAVEDLEQHSKCRPGEAPIAADFIATVAALGDVVRVGEEQKQK